MISLAYIQLSALAIRSGTAKTYSTSKQHVQAYSCQHVFKQLHRLGAAESWRPTLEPVEGASPEVLSPKAHSPAPSYADTSASMSGHAGISHFPAVYHPRGGCFGVMLIKVSDLTLPYRTVLHHAVPCTCVTTNEAERVICEGFRNHSTVNALYLGCNFLCWRRRVAGAGDAAVLASARGAVLQRHLLRARLPLLHICALRWHLRPGPAQGEHQPGMLSNMTASQAHVHTL